MLRLKFAPVFVLFLGLIVLNPAPALAWRTAQTAKAVCENKKISLDWTFINKDDRSIKVTVKDTQSGQAQPARTVAAGSAASGTIATGKTTIQAGEISFLVKWTDGEKGTDTKEQSYKKLSCETSPVAGEAKTDAEPTTQPLPNTGPLDTFGPFAAFLAASASSWLITRKELIDSAKRR